MNTTRSTRPTGSPAYYLGRPASTWEAALPRRKTNSPSADHPALRDAALRFYVHGGSRWN
jgi:hypothetical protein